VKDHAGRVDHGPQARRSHVRDHGLDAGPTTRLIETRPGALALEGPLHGEEHERTSVLGDQPPAAVVFE
jgi:hypothetical protein